MLRQFYELRGQPALVPEAEAVEELDSHWVLGLTGLSPSRMKKTDPGVYTAAVIETGSEPFFTIS